jgi:hypothetical protein
MSDARHVTPEAHSGSAGDTLEGIKLAVSWLWVGIPAVWGVYHVVVDALKLFR